MKRTKILGFSFIPVLFWFLSYVQPSFAQKMNGWEAVGIQSFKSAQFLTDQKIIVVGGVGRVELSSDGGKTWKANTQNPQIGFQSVSFIDSLHGLIGAWTGQIFSSSDGGLTWAMRSGPLAYRLNKILMVTPDTAYACGSAGSIFRTVNGGKNWDSLSSGVAFYLDNLYFQNSRNGYALGDSGTLLKTSDAGNTWIPQTLDTNLQLLGIDFLDSLRGAICGQWGTMYNTSDGGKSWHKNFVDQYHELLLSSITFHSPLHLSAIGFGGGFFESTNGGITWSSIDRPKELQDVTLTPNGGFRKQRDKGWAVGFYGVILLSSDSGKSWQQSASCPIRDAYLSDMRFFDSTNGYAVGDHNLVLQTSNGGETWKSLTEQNNTQLFRIYSPSPDTCWVFGAYGWLIKTFDGWKTSRQESPPTVANLPSLRFIAPYDISMVSRKIGYIVSDTTIWKTIDAGLTWGATIWRGYLYPDILENGILEKVFFPTENIGFVSGFYSIPVNASWDTVKDYGIMFRTQNGGLTWDTLDYGYRNRIYGIYFWNANEGIITCDSGNVMKTSDGGNTWRRSFQIADMIPGQSLLSDVNFISTKVGYITANPGKIFLSTDAGETWNLDIDFKTAGFFYTSTPTRIIFPDSNTVMVSGYQGMVRKKIDLKELSVERTESGSQLPYAWITIKQNPVTAILSFKLYWYLTQQSAISLRIYDILGRPLMDLSNELLQVNTTWGADLTTNVSSLPSGVYLLVLNAGGVVKSERFIIAK